MRWLNGITNATNILQEMVRDREAWHASCSPWGRKESDITGRLSNTTIHILILRKDMHMCICT